MQEDIARYTCQLALPGFGAQAQLLLQQAKVLIVGMGGLGCPAAQYLASTGVGTLGIADFDIINPSNLHRQVLYTPADAGQKKVAITAQKLQAQNPHIQVLHHDAWLDDSNVEQLIAGYDIVVDATDNFETHYLLNDACVLAGKPMVHGAIYQYEGHAAVWNVLNPDGTRSPNYRDLFPNINPLLIPDCADGGVLPTIAGITGTMQANEVIKLITGVGEVLAGKLLLFDALTMQSRIINIGTATKTNITELPRTIHVPLVSKEQLAKGEYTLIDVRTAEEHAAHNIGGTNIPMQLLEENIAQLDTTKPIVCYCASGKRSTQAAKWLKGKLPGVDVSSLNGGIRNL